MSSEILIALVVFTGGYLINIFYITVLYHRGLAHSAVELSPIAQFFIQYTGSWITGIDPKGWGCMHRLHHSHSDTMKDPHSPLFQGVWGIWAGQLKSYKRILKRLAACDKDLTSLVKDIPFDIHFLNRKRLWLAPYLLHFAIGITISFFTSSYLIGAAYFFGIMSHPVQGWMVNSLAHKYGYRNFESGDNSKNNTMVSLLVFGEGFQNNHHQFPESAKFSVKWFELDFDYALCVIASKFNFIKMRSSKKI